MIGKFLNSFKKEQEEVAQTPTPSIPTLMETEKPVDLMAADPVVAPALDLMASDPVDETPAEIIEEKKPEIIEQPGLENQLEPRKIAKEEYVTLQPEQSAAPQAQAMDAFSMSVPVPEAMPRVMDLTPEETLETLEERLETTQKICICGTPNDPLAKFCVSCGKTYE